jgi:hypothetical protein
MNGWSYLEEVPRDGTQVLFFIPEDDRSPLGPEGRIVSGRYDAALDDYLDDAGDLIEPTVWRPMIRPPSEVSGVDERYRSAVETAIREKMKRTLLAKITSTEIHYDSHADSWVVLVRLYYGALRVFRAATPVGGVATFVEMLCPPTGAEKVRVDLSSCYSEYRSI